MALYSVVASTMFAVSVDVTAVPCRYCATVSRFAVVSVTAVKITGWVKLSNARTCCASDTSVVLTVPITSANSALVPAAIANEVSATAATVVVPVLGALAISVSCTMVA